MDAIGCFIAIVTLGAFGAAFGYCAVSLAIEMIRGS